MQQRRDKEVDYHNLLCLLVLHCDWSILQAIFQCTANLNQKFNGSEISPSVWTQSKNEYLSSIAFSVCTATEP